MPPKKRPPSNTVNLDRIRNVGIVIKQKVPAANDLAVDVAQYLRKNDCIVHFASESKEICSLAHGTQCLSKDDLVMKCDLIIVLGGDGTFLSVARLMIERSVPIMGVNMGTLGFLTEIKKDEIKDMIDQVLIGNFRVSKRTMLECNVLRGTKKIAHSIIVNDVVLSKAAIARIIETEIVIDDCPVATIRADGLIIGTPTGSTAYALAAGGPIIEPTVPALVLAPICPHSLALRPLVVDDRSHVVIRIRHNNEAILTLDGQASLTLLDGDVVEVSRFDRHPLRIIQAPGRNYFGLLREKLKYGYRT